jgi:membrane associated rhomboid family serine protease
MLSFNERTRKIGVPVEMPFWLLPILAIVPLIIIGLFVELPIGNMAHLGGLVAGILYGLFLRTRYKNKVSYIQEHI